MTTPTPGQSYQGNTYTPQAPPQAGPTGQSQGGFPERGSHSAQGQYQTPTQFEKYCVIHIATTCDEHGVYVTKDSAEVIEIGWTILDARDAGLPEVCLISTMPLKSHVYLSLCACAETFSSSTTNPCLSSPSTLPSHPYALL